MIKLSKEFLTGFEEGWGSFWSPFTGLCKALAATWRRHVSMPHGRNCRHA